MTKNILIDKLPTKTWNFLKVNSAEIQWDSESAAKTEENIILKKDEKNEPVRLDNSGAEGYTENVVNVTAEKAARGVIFEVCRGNAPMLSADFSSVSFMELARWVKSGSLSLVRVRLLLYILISSAAVLFSSASLPSSVIR